MRIERVKMTPERVQKLAGADARSVSADNAALRREYVATNGSFSKRTNPVNFYWHFRRRIG